MQNYYYTNSNNEKQRQIKVVIDIISKIIDYGTKRQMEYYRNAYTNISTDYDYMACKDWVDFVIKMLKIADNEFGNNVLLAYLERNSVDNNLYNKIGQDLEFLVYARNILLHS